MKKFLPIIIGLFVGITASVTTILLQPVAHSEDGSSWYNNMLANSDTLDWGDVWAEATGSYPGKDLYNLVYAKLNLAPGKDALREVAGKYGLTVDEARAVLNGSVLPIFNNPDRQSAQLTQEDAFKILKGLQEDYEFLEELFAIEQEVDAAVRSSELFANGDTGDSGFDLVHDLSIIEEILFLEKTAASVGAPFSASLDSPYNPTEDERTFDNYVYTSTPVAVLPLRVGTSKQGLEDGEEVGILSVGEEDIEVEILGEDVCPAPDSLLSALEEYDAVHAQEDSAPDSSAERAGVLRAAGGAAADAGDDDSELVAAKGDQWLEEWCKGFGFGDPEQKSGLGTGGFKSLGGADTSELEEAFGNELSSNGFAVNIGLCFELEAVKAKVSSYQPGDSCILCEVEQINKYLDDTLSKSLVPNKATGNLLESAKCKEAGAAVDVQFVTIWNPIPTPPNDDIIFGKNIFEEWNKFIERYTPLSPLKAPIDNFYNENGILEQQIKTLIPGLEQSDIANDLSRIKAEYTAKAALSLENYEGTNDATNIMLYSQSVLGEIRQMNSLFKNFKATMLKIDKDALQKISKIGNKD